MSTMFEGKSPGWSDKAKRGELAADFEREQAARKEPGEARSRDPVRAAAEEVLEAWDNAYNRVGETMDEALGRLADAVAQAREEER